MLSAEVGARLHMPDHLRGCEVETLLDVMTFLDVEKRIVQGLLDRVTSTADAIDPEAVGNIVDRRQAGHWVSSNSAPEVQRNARRAVYQALAIAAQFLHLRNTHEAGFDSPDMTAMYKDYESRLFRFDQLYRHFCENADAAGAQGWDMLKPLREEIEACYCNGYLAKIALAWGKFVDMRSCPGGGQSMDIQNQYTGSSTEQVRPLAGRSR